MAPTSTRATSTRCRSTWSCASSYRRLAITDAELERPSIVGGASIYPFVQNILLGLRSEGLGASFTTLLVPAEEAVRELLEIPEGVAMAGHIAVGHRADPWPAKLSRNPASEFVFGERFGAPW